MYACGKIHSALRGMQKRRGHKNKMCLLKKKPIPFNAYSVQTC